MPDQTEMTIRHARDADFDALWPILRGVIRAGDTYAIDPGLTREAVFDLWMRAPRATYVAESGDEILGTYYIKTNQQGGGAHVCNCGYMVASAARGRGVAHAMCLASQDQARAMGYLAMQFNFVVATNLGAIKLWRSLGFETVGLLPRAFAHPTQGLVDALVMYKWLAERAD
ncbi:Ribosomal protein S18 acetylase RimI [Roseovarius lutimaris]|uniref:Ribosomal protein S18 acetylase RimI n=1 Tax=Roseovarius lutimaris TaxID=1005928 RepID=A0A1I5B4I6_9RHOB|nr:N-acetyltransferase [Roseovarius lutimaris]SFN69520.1 Ribosomal protein S18 acetylase RimI [Roseovarius lutimaris]